MRLSVIVTLSILLGCIMAQEESTFEINNAQQALLDLRQDALDNLHELQEAWKINEISLTEQINSLSQSLATKGGQCKANEEAKKKTEEDLQKTIEYIEWLENQIEKKKSTLDELLKRRCEVNKQFIETIKREKIALSLLEFIKIAIQKKESFDFIQMQQFHRSFATFLHAYNKNDMNALLAIKQDFVDESQFNIDVDFSTKDRTDEEIGQGHIDNNKGKLDLDDFTNGRRRNWPAYKEELLQVLDELKQKISTNIKKAIDDEIAASVALANFKNHTLKEIELFEKELAEQRSIKVQLEAQLVKDGENVEKCSAEKTTLQNQLASTTEEYNRRKESFEKKKSALEEEIAIFNEVIQMYDSGVFNNDDEFKARADDYIDDKDFDNGSYNEREVPKIDFLGNGN